MWGLILWSVVRHRKRSDELPKQTAYNLPLEIVYTILPFLIIAALFFFTVVVQDKVEKRSNEPRRDHRGPGVQVELAVHLPGQPRATDGDAGQHGRDDVRRSRSWCCPTDRTIRFELTSADVIHSFWVPEFLFKRDVIPGNENGRNNVFEVTSTRRAPTSAAAPSCAARTTRT